MTRAKAKRTPARKRATPRPKARTRDDAPAHGLPVPHGVEYVPAPHGVELPPDFPASVLAAEAQTLLESYSLPATDPEARLLAVLAARLRRAWLDAEARSIERASPERRIAAAACRKALAALLTAVREFASLPVRH